jgi:hypothetical protein
MGLSYLSFEDARAFVRSKGIGSRAEWKQWSLTQLPDNIPGAPDMHYRAEFIGFPDWLGCAADYDIDVARGNRESDKSKREVAEGHNQSSRGMKRSRKAAQTGSTAEASQDASIPPSQPDPSTQLTEAHSMRGSGVARKPNARTISSPRTAQYSVVTVSNVSSKAASKKKPSSIAPTSTRPRRPTSGQPYTKEESLRTEQIHTKEIVDLVLKLSKEDAEAAGNLLSRVLNHSNLRDAKVISILHQNSLKPCPS